jgi:RecA-family ATPase
MRAMSDNIRELEARLGRKVPEPPKPPERHAINWAELAERTPPERPWLISHWLSTGATLMAGSGGVGKSLLAQTIATALALGVPFIDSIGEPQRVLMWMCEDDHDEIWRRQVAICSLFGCKLQDLEGRLIIEPRLGRENSLLVPVYGVPTWTPLREELADQVRDYQACILILDNIGQTFGCSENDRHAVTVYVNGCGVLASATLLLGHPAKAAGSEFSGSTAWENAVRMRWYLGTTLPDQDPDRAEQSNEEPDLSVRYLAKRKTNYTTRDYRKMTCQNGVICIEGQTGTAAGPYLAAESRASAERWILQGIADLGRINKHGSAAPSSREFLPKKLIAMKLAGPFTLTELRDAMNRLLLAQRIKEAEVGKLANRMPRLGLIEC